MKCAVTILSMMATPAYAGAHASMVCMSKGNEEMVKEIRTSLKCADAKPTECKCTGNNQVQKDCEGPEKTLWASAGKKCITATADKDKSWAKHDWQYPANTADDCQGSSGTGPNLEPGSYDCTKVKVVGSDPATYKEHKFEKGFAGYNDKYDTEKWCTQPSCYVDPCTCDKLDISASSWFKKTNGAKMYYSGNICGTPYEFKAALCSGKTTNDKCIADTGCKWVPKSFCRSKTEAETMTQLRTTLNCPNAAPTTCPCSGNNQVQFECPASDKTLWSSTGKKCITASADKNKKWAKHDWSYPANTADDCLGSSGKGANWEPGSYDCTKVKVVGSDPPTYKEHKFEKGFAGYNGKYDTEKWCTQPSCYVDPCTCNMKDFSASSWFKKQDGSKMYYSGMKCGAAYTFKAALCDGQKTKETCIGDTGCEWDVTGGSAASDDLAAQVSTATTTSMSMAMLGLLASRF